MGEGGGYPFVRDRGVEVVPYAEGVAPTPPAGHEPITVVSDGDSMRSMGHADVGGSVPLSC